MAMRPRGGRSGGATTPSRTSSSSVWPVFADFKPEAEWQQDAESHSLIIYLPGFLKDQIRVSTEGRNTIRARGERQGADNKWSRFLEDFQVPENCEMNSARATFQHGKIKIRILKKSVGKPQEALSPKTTSTDIPKQSTPQKRQEGVFPGIGASQPIDQKSSHTQNTSGDPTNKQHQANVQRDRTSISPFRDAKSTVRQDAGRKESSSLKEKHIESERADGVIKKRVAKEENSERSKELPEDETASKMKLKTDDGAAATFKAKEMDKESKEKQVVHSSDADHGAFKMDRYKKAVKGIAELNEERQLVVNMGVAVLVIAALTAYVTYTFASGEDKK